MPNPKFPENITESYNNQKYDAPYNMKKAQQSYNKYMFAKKQYQDLINFLNTTTETDPTTGKHIGYGKNEFGFQKNMDAETLDLLREKCHNLNMAGQQLLSEMKLSSSSKKKDQLAFDIQYDIKMARADANAIDNIDLNNIPSYTSMKRNANNIIIDAGQDKIDTVGAMMSSRMELRYVDENGELKTGYFTKDINVGDLKPKDRKIYDKLNVPGNENINSRNSSMSDIAALLNMENLICESKEMTIMHNGKEIHGSFMTKAKGYNFDDLISDENIFDGKYLTIDYNSTVKCASDMMVLDYICLNVDRHDGNHFYNVGIDKNGDYKLKGFYGIDNDMSFGAVVPQEGQTIHHLPPVNIIRFLHPDTAARVMRLTKETITATLVATGRSEEEIDACWQRTKQIQDRIKNHQVTLKETFTSEDFEKLRPNTKTQKWISPAHNAAVLEVFYDKARRKHRNMIDQYKSNEQGFIRKKLAEYTKKYPKEFNNPDVEKKVKAALKDIYYKQEKIRYEKAKYRDKVLEGIKGLQNQVRMDSKLTIKQQSKDFNKLFNKLWQPTKKDVPEYHKMYSSMKALSETLGSFEKQELDHLSDMDRNRIAQAYKDVHEKIRNYIPVISKGASKNDIKRITISQGIMDICIKAQDQREQAVNELNETMASAFKILQQANKEVQAIAQEKGEASPEYDLAKKGLEAKGFLAGCLGRLENPSDDDHRKITSNLATLTILDKISRMKSEEPQRHADLMQYISSKQTSLETMASNLLANKNFHTLANSVDFRFALTNRADRMLSSEWEKMKSFDGIIIGSDSIDKIADTAIDSMMKK